MQKVIEFLKDVKLEIKKVVWPTRKETVKYTWIVIGVSITTAMFLGLVDGTFDFLLRIFLLQK